jgi:hypothetical protein
VRGSQTVGASVNYSPEFLASEPNLSLLRHVVESGGGKLLDPTVMALNPFVHNRLKTFQPRDLWEWLLRFAVILFTLDVAVRRIQIDRDEWLRATQTIRRWIFFWQGVPRPAEADVSLAALLARRDEVRSRQTAPAVEPRAELFRPTKPVTEVLPGTQAAEPAQPEPAAPGVTGPESAAEAETATTTSRLLEAKRRAQKRKR